MFNHTWLSKGECNLKLIKKYTSELGFVRIAMLLYAAGFLIGVILAFISKDSYMNQLSNLNTTFFTNLNSAKIDHNQLFQLILIKKIKSLYLLFLVCTTILGIPYLTLYLLLKGFNLGFLLAASILQFKIKGIVLFIIYLFPQCLVYIPVLVLAVIRGYHMNRQIHYSSQNKKTTKKLIKEQIPFLLIASVLLLVGSLMEAYFNASIIQKVIPSLF